MDKKIFHALKTVSFGSCLMLMTVSCNPNDGRIAQSATAAVRAVTPDVSVNVQNGVVTLSGTVRDPATRSTLDSTVRGLKGVVSVVDKTTLKTAAAPPPPPPPPRPSSRPYAMDYPDTLVARTLDTAFKYNYISGVKTKVVNGVITLTGSASKKDLKTILLIANESNPKKVINQLTIK